MPEMTGVRLLEQAIQIAPNAIRIMVSAYTDTDDLLDAINVGQAHHYVVKPVSQERLLSAVHAALETRDRIMGLQKRA